MAVTKAKTEIKATAIYKISSMNCWMVPSNSSDTMYRVCFENTSWTCECKHGEIQASRGQDAHCCHVAAVQESVKANLPKVEAKPVETVNSCITCGRNTRNIICGRCTE